MVNRNEIQHGMVVVEDTVSNTVVGFLEIGMLPPPTSFEQQSLATTGSPDILEAKSVNPKISSSEDSGSAGGVWEAAARVAAATSSKVFSKKKVNIISAGEDGSSSDVGETADVDESRRRRIEQRRKQPDAAYLANVVVDKEQRRRGIGRMMVASAVEITRALWPDEKRLYVTVEQVRRRLSAAVYTARKSVGLDFGRAEIRVIADVALHMLMTLICSQGIATAV